MKTNNLQSAITQEIKDSQVQHDYKLLQEESTFLTNELTLFVTNAIDKFIQGGMEHNPDADDKDSFLWTVQHKVEIRNEIIDMFFYNAADNYKNRTKCTLPKI